VREARDSAVDFVRKNIAQVNRFAERKSMMCRAGDYTRRFWRTFTHRTGHSIGEETHGTALTSTTSRRAIHGVSFPEFVFPSSPELPRRKIWRFDRKSTFTFQTKTSKSPGKPIQTEIIPILTDSLTAKVCAERHHPADAKPVFKHSEFGRPKWSSQEALSPCAVRKRVEEALGFLLVRTTIESEKPSKRVGRRTCHPSHQDCFADTEAGMHRFVFHSRLRHAWFGSVLETAKHLHLAPTALR